MCNTPLCIVAIALLQLPSFMAVSTPHSPYTQYTTTSTNHDITPNQGDGYNTLNTNLVYPADFLYGVATAAYQIEGCVDCDNRSASQWDIYSHMNNSIANNDTGDIADDSYDQWKLDLQHLIELGVNSYRFSISWSRVLPHGINPINQLAIDHYNMVIDDCLQYDIMPMITMYHWDLPYELSTLAPADIKLADGFNDINAILPYWLDYVDTLFDAFGDRVQLWATVNEIRSICFAPINHVLREQNWDESTSPYNCAHTLLLLHAYAVQLYRTKYQSIQLGNISLVIDAGWSEPLTHTHHDKQAAKRSLIWGVNWLLEPLLYGHYPQIMIDRVGDRLPQFTANQSALLNNSIDFICLNHYTSRYISNNSTTRDLSPDESTYYTDSDSNSLVERHGKLIGPHGESEWLYSVPWGITKLLRYIDSEFNHPIIYITENGYDVRGESDMSISDAIHDIDRVQYYQQYLHHISLAMQHGVDIRGYYAWSLLDNFEWNDGYTKRFGIIYIDYNDSQRTRYRKDSYKWYRQWITNKRSIYNNTQQYAIQNIYNNKHC